MQKNKKMTWDTRTLVFLALLAAMQIVLTRLVVVDLGSYRISVGSVCVIGAGMWFGPFAGAACGMVADLIGCVLKGYAVNPFITVGTMMWGIIPALFRVYMTGSRKKKVTVLCLSTTLTSVLSSLICTTTGLVLMNGYSLFAILPGRLVQWAIMTPIYCVLICTLYFSPVTNMVLNATIHKQKRPAENL